MIVVLRGGMLTTVQDRGRWGWQHLGVPPAGPMDPFSLRLANRLVGNDEWEAALEVTLIGPKLRFTADATIAVTGADLGAAIDGRPLRTSPHIVPAGAMLTFTGRRFGTRAYLAVRGGLDVPAVLSSRATSVPSRFDGLAGRALRSGDTLEIAARAVRGVPAGISADLVNGYPQPAVLRYIPGPDDDRFAPGTLEQFTSTTFTLASESNRMGYRLEGPALAIAGGGQLLSEGSPRGSIQVPPSGRPILLMADHQTTGGYARIGTVITADQTQAGQLAPGDAVRFAPCTLEAAVSALREQERALHAIGGAA